MVFLRLLLIGGLLSFTIYEIVAIVKQIRNNKKAKTQNVDASENKDK